MRVCSSLVVSLVFALYAPLGASGAGTPRSAAGTRPCDEPAQIRGELERLHGADFATLPREERNKKIYAAFIELLAKHPMDVHVHRSYQDFLSREYEEKLDEARTRYLQLLEQSPDSALYDYLLGRMRVGEEPDVARQHFEKAAAKDSSWPWPHLGLAYLYSRNGPLGDPEKLDLEVSALLSLCPTSDDSFAYLGEVRNPEVKRRASMLLRTFLDTSATPEKLSLYPQLWSLEFRLSAPADHPEIRARVAADLSRLRKLDWKNEEDWWQALYEGYKLVPDPAGLDWVAQQILTYAPQTWTAQQIHVVDWKERNRPPSGAGSEAEEQYERSLLAESEKWTKLWPDNVMVWLDRFQIMRDLPAVAAEQLAQVADYLLESEAKNRGEFHAWPPVRFQVASYYVESGQRLEKVNDLVDAGLKDEQEMIDWMKQRAGDDGKQLKESIEQERALRWQAWGILAECALKMEKAGDAAMILKKMEDELRETALKKDAPADEGSSYRTHQAAFWRISAMFAEHEQRPVEALTFYHNAIMATPDGMDDDTMKGEVVPKAQSIWKQLGGTDAGWSTWHLSTTLGGLGSTGARSEWQQIELSLPDSTLTDITGKVWKISDLRGKTLLVNIWATWCGPCRAELPQFQQLYNELKDRKDLVIITLNVDENVGAIEPYLSKQGFTFPVLMAADYVNSVVKQLSIPRNWIVNGNGVAVFELNGFDPESQTWKEDARSHLDMIMQKGQSAAPQQTAD